MKVSPNICNGFSYLNIPQEKDLGGTVEHLKLQVCPGSPFPLMPSKFESICQWPFTLSVYAFWSHERAFYLKLTISLYYSLVLFRYIHNANITSMRPPSHPEICTRLCKYLS